MSALTKRLALLLALIVGLAGGFGSPASAQLFRYAAKASAAAPVDILGGDWTIVVAAGQSNAVGYGRGTNITATDAPGDGIYQWSPDGGGDAGRAARVAPATQPLLWPGAPNAQFGPSASVVFAKRALAAAPIGRRILIIPTAIGSTNLYNSVWAAPSGSSYLQTLQAITAAKAAIVGAGGTVSASYLLWQQGEGDGGGGVSGANYTAAFADMVAGWRGPLPAMKVITGGMVPEWLATSGGGQVIDAAQQAMGGTVADYTYVPGIAGNNLNGKPYFQLIHGSAQGERLMGAAMATAAGF